ncbi:hypothetical protein Tco_1061527 [Tanacetum coccineum]
MCLDTYHYATPVIQSTITKSLENVVLAKSSSQPKSTYEAATSLTEFELKKILLDKMQKSKSYRAAQEHRDLYDALVKSYMLDKDLFESYGKSYSLKRDHEDKDKDEDPPAGSDKWLKRKKTRKDVKPSKGSKSKELKTSSSKGTKSQTKSSSKSAQAEESVFESADTEMPQNQGGDLGNTDDQPNVEGALKSDWFKKPERPLTLDPDWNANKSIDFRPSQTWISKIAKAEKYPLTFRTDGHSYQLLSICIEDMVPSPWILVNVAYDKYVVWRITHWGPKQQWFYGYASNRVSKHDVFSTERIITVTYVKVMKWYDYGYLEEIVVQREAQKLYKFKEGDFPRLNLHDIEGMLLLLVQKKIINLEKDVIFNLNVALRMSDISKRTPYTAYNNPQGIIYVDQFKRNRLICSDELYKFSDGTLTSIRSVLHDISSNLRMDYLPKRRWSTLDKQRSRIMIKAIDKLQLERRLMRNLEKFVDGR